LLGQLQRRQRQKEASSNTFREALQAFDAMGAALWADRTRAELARAKVPRSRDVVGLTPSEQRVAELAASGMTNRDVAAALFISPKTVETTWPGSTANWESSRAPSWAAPSAASNRAIPSRGRAAVALAVRYLPITTLAQQAS
jgi:FixJ family two-component response regulator